MTIHFQYRLGYLLLPHKLQINPRSRLDELAGIFFELPLPQSYIKTMVRETTEIFNLERYQITVITASAFSVGTVCWYRPINPTRYVTTRLATQQVAPALQNHSGHRRLLQKLKRTIQQQLRVTTASSYLSPSKPVPPVMSAVRINSVKVRPGSGIALPVMQYRRKHPSNSQNQAGVARNNDELAPVRPCLAYLCTLIGFESHKSVSHWTKFNERLGYSTEALRRDLRELRALGATLEATENIIDQSAHLFRQATKRGILIGHSLESMAGAYMRQRAGMSDRFRSSRS